MSLIDLFNVVGRIIVLGVCLVERPKDGLKKKQEVKQMVYSFMKDFNIKLPIPETVFEYILDLAIDNVVRFLNDTVWKNAA